MPISVKNMGSLQDDLLRISVAQIAQMIGWDAIGSTSYDLLVDVCRRFIDEVGRCSVTIANHCNRTDILFGDLEQALDRVGFSLGSLNHYMTKVAPNPFLYRLTDPTFRINTSKTLRIQMPKHQELFSRPDYYDSWLPSIRLTNENESIDLLENNSEDEDNIAKINDIYDFYELLLITKPVIPQVSNPVETQIKDLNINGFTSMTALEAKYIYLGKDGEVLSYGGKDGILPSNDRPKLDDHDKALFNREMIKAGLRNRLEQSRSKKKFSKFKVCNKECQQERDFKKTIALSPKLAKNATKSKRAAIIESSLKKHNGSKSSLKIAASSSLEAAKKIKKKVDLSKINGIKTGKKNIRFGLSTKLKTTSGFDPNPKHINNLCIKSESNSEKSTNSNIKVDDSNVKQNLDIKIKSKKFQKSIRCLNLENKKSEKFNNNNKYSEKFLLKTTSGVNGIQQGKDSILNKIEEMNLKKEKKHLIYSCKKLNLQENNSKNLVKTLNSDISPSIKIKPVKEKVSESKKNEVLQTNLSIKSTKNECAITSTSKKCQKINSFDTNNSDILFQPDLPSVLSQVHFGNKIQSNKEVKVSAPIEKYDSSKAQKEIKIIPKLRFKISNGHVLSTESNISSSDSVQIKTVSQSSLDVEPRSNSGENNDTLQGSKRLKKSKKDVGCVLITQTIGNYSQKIWYCPTCRTPDDGTPMIGCDNCDEWFHYRCERIKKPPSETEQWFCSQCKTSKKQLSLNNQIESINHSQKQFKKSKEISRKSQKNKKSKESTGFERQKKTKTDLWICPCCKKNNNDSPMIGCDECNAWFHFFCVGIVVPPREEDSWFCAMCK